MNNPGLTFGPNLAKRRGAAKPAPPARKLIFGDDGDDSDGGGTTKVEEIGGGDLQLNTSSSKKASSSKEAESNSVPPGKPPRLKAKAQSNTIIGDLSSSLSSRKNAEAAQELDPNVYEYDSVYDSLKPKRRATDEDAERKPKYMQSLMQAAEVRKRDALIAEEKKIAREREAEGGEYAGKEKFVTEAYKKQQEENRRIEEEEKRREEEEAKKNKGGGMSAFYRRLLDKDEKRHAEALKVAEERAKDENHPHEEDNDEDDREIAEAALARELNEKGASVAVNEDGQVVDRRQLLKGGLNVGTRKKEAVQRVSERPKEASRHFNGTPFNKQTMRERQSRMLEEQLEQSMKRSRENEEAERQEAERAAKSRKTAGEISSARDRYLARKKAADEARSKGLTE